MKALRSMPVKETPAHERKSRLAAAGHVYADLARVANVTYSMAYKWMNGERVSSACQRAFDILTRGLA